MPVTMGGPRVADPLPELPERVSVEATPRDQFCVGRGLPLRTVRRAGSVADCGSRLARKLFSYALCSCEDLSLPRDAFQVDSFDSRLGTYQPRQTAASIGVNRSIVQLAADTQVFGSVFVAGANPLQLGSSKLSVIGDLKTNGALEVSAAGSRIARDLWVAGDVRGPVGAIAVGRDVYQPAGRAGADVLAAAGRSDASTAVSVRPPCACDDDALLDITALVAEARNANDNLSAGWSTSSLRIGSLVSDSLVLPCGRLFVDEISLEGLSSYFVVFSGRTALFVAGNMSVAAASTLVITQLGTTGELDIFVGGDLELQSTLGLGTSTRPAAVRIYVAGQIRGPGPLGLNANLYAPRATIELVQPEGLQLFGSIFARSIQRLSSPLMHYDRAIQAVDAECTAPAPRRCDSCYQCPDSQACVAGSCGACARDADCCRPSVCTNGRCEPLQP